MDSPLLNLPGIKTLYQADADPSLLLVFAALGLSRTVMPSVITTDNINALSSPYARPLDHSYADFQDVVARVNGESAINANISDGVTGNNNVVVTLPGGLTEGKFFAIKVTSSRGDNDAPSTWNIQVDGFFSNGTAWQFPQTEFEYAAGNATKGDIIILVTQVISTGPSLAAGRLRNVGAPNVDLQNGAPNMVAANGVTLTVTGGVANQRHTIQVATKVSDIYALLQDVALGQILTGEQPQSSVAKISEVYSPRAREAVRAVKSFAARPLPLRAA